MRCLVVSRTSRNLPRGSFVRTRVAVPSSQQTMRRWLIGQGVARVTPNIEWQLDGTRPGLSFITMPPGFAEGVGEIHGIAEADEPWEAE